MEGKAVVAALLSTLLLPLLLSQPPRAIADVHLSVAALADRLSVGGGSTTAFFEACSRFLDLLSRRNMILLCNAILLIVLRDAGLLACPAAARRNGHGDGDGASSSSSRSVVTVTATAASSPVAPSAASSRRRPHATRSDIVVWRPSKVAVVDVLDVDENGDDDRLRRHRTQRGHEPATATTMAPCPLPPAPEKLSYDCPDDSVSDDHVSAGAIVISEEGKSSPVFDSDHHFADADTNGRDVEAEAVDQCVAGDDHDDVDDMNRRFEEFIANTRRQMQLESLQLQLVMKA